MGPPEAVYSTAAGGRDGASRGTLPAMSTLAIRAARGRVAVVDRRARHRGDLAFGAGADLALCDRNADALADTARGARQRAGAC
jgi:hypothetical protein